jgi:hypothetical protein
VGSGDRPPVGLGGLDQRELTRRSVQTIVVHIRWRVEDRMRVIRIMANLRVADVETAKSFYTDYLGLSTEEFNMGWGCGCSTVHGGSR